MSYETIILERQDHIGVLTLNRADSLNAVNGVMFREIRAALDEVAEDADVRVLVLTGAGRAFCASADLKEDWQERIGVGYPPSLEEIRQFLRAYPQGITKRLRSMEKPTIAMVNGLAVADAVDWALSCDIRIGSESARFMNGFMRMAVFPNTGATWLYPRVMGLGRALEFLYTGDWMEAEEAYRLGVLNRVVPGVDLENETLTLARRIAEGSPTVLRLVKTYTYKGLDMGLDESLEMAAIAEAFTSMTADHEEAVAAFKEKRKPVFRGL